MTASFGPVSKLSAEKPFFDVDFSDVLGTDTLTGVTYTPPGGSGITIDNTTIINSVVARGRFNGGTVGGPYDVVGQVTTTGGQTLDFILRLLITAAADWTFSNAPSTVARDAVRLLVGDTNPDDPQLNDAGVDYALAIQPNNYTAAAMVADMIAAKYARLVSMSTDGMSVQLQQKMDQYQKLASLLRAQAKTYGTMMVPVIGGISKSDIDTVNSNTDLVPRMFQIGAMDNPNSTIPTFYYPVI